jgi:hypothetical protein
LIQPEVRDQFGGLRRVFHPRRLPNRATHQFRALARLFRNRSRGAFNRFRVGRADCDDEFVGVREILLVQLQSLDCRDVR